MKPIAHHPFTHFKLLCNLGRLPSPSCQPDDLRSFEFPNGRASCIHQAFYRLLLFFAQFSQSQHCLASLLCLLVLLLPKVYHICRMHHLVLGSGGSTIPSHFRSNGTRELHCRAVRRICSQPTRPSGDFGGKKCRDPYVKGFV